jgi:hypothetical protein
MIALLFLAACAPSVEQVACLPTGYAEFVQVTACDDATFEVCPVSDPCYEMDAHPDPVYLVVPCGAGDIVTATW